jgi:hypothetical protein
MAAGNFTEACPKFAAAARLSQTAGVRLNLAECYARLGKTASAWAKANEALTLAERAGDTAAAELARGQMADLKPKLSSLTIGVPRAAVVAGMEIALDGEPIPDAVWNTPLPVDPGEHEIVVKVPAHRPWSTRAVVTGVGTRSTVSVLARLADEPGPATDLPARASPGATPILAAVAGGLGLVGLGVGTAFGLDAMSHKSQYQQHQVDGRCIDEQCVTLSSEAVTSATASTIGFVAGGALMAGGLVLWLVAPGRGAEGPGIALAPVAGPQTAGVGVSGSW